MAHKIRAVLDTNVLVSALLSHKQSPPRKIYSAFKGQKFIIVTSSSILKEVSAVLKRPQLRINPALTQEAIKELKTRSIFITNTPRINAVLQDPADNKFIECAVAANADAIVTGDIHLLNLKDYSGIHIIKPAAFTKKLKS